MQPNMGYRFDGVGTLSYNKVGVQAYMAGAVTIAQHGIQVYGMGWNYY